MAAQDNVRHSRRSASLALVTLGFAFNTLAPSTPVAVHGAERPIATDQDLRSEGIKLRPGDRLERRLETKQTDTYSVSLPEGSYEQIFFSQQSVDIVVSVMDDQGREIRQINAFDDLDESVTVGAKDGATQLLQVRAKDEGPGTYRIRIESWRESEQAAERRIRAEALMTQGRALFARGTPDAMAQANGTFQEVLSLWRAAGDRHGEVHALQDLGITTSRLGRKRDALLFLENAVALARDLPRSLDEASTLNDVGAVYDDLGELRRARSIYDEALKAAERDDLQLMQAEILQNLGVVENRLGERDAALAHYVRAMPILKRIGDSRRQALVLSGMARINDQLGKKQTALDLFQESLAIRIAVEDLRGQAQSLTGIGLVYASLSDSSRAVKYLENALPLYRASTDRIGEAATLTNLGTLSDTIGDDDAARKYLEGALVLQRSLADRLGEASTLIRLGRFFTRTREPARAISNLAAAVALKHEVGDRAGEAAALVAMGLAHLSAGEADLALPSFREALTLARALGDRLNELGALGGIARAQSAKGDLAAARDASKAAVLLVERLRSEVLSDALRTSFIAAARPYYELELDLLMRMHRPGDGLDAEALAIAERARARSLMETLSEARADLRRGIDPTLIEQDRMLADSINAAAAAQRRLLASTPSEEEARAAGAKLDDLIEQQHDLHARIRADSPRFASVTQPEPLGIREIQQDVLDEHTQLLEYVLGNDRSYVWVVSRDALATAELPGRAEIERLARQVHELASMHDRIAAGSLDYRQAAAALSSMILGPVVDALKKERLIVVADGALQYVPFAALPIPGSNPRSVRWLNADHEIVYEPSASVLGLLRKHLGNRPPAPKTLAILADPVYEASDARVANAATNAVRAEPLRTPARAVEQQVVLDRAVGSERLARLPFTRREAEAIARLAAPTATFKAVDFDASRATATSGVLSAYRIDHFAAHAVLNTEHPELSGVVLSLVDARGQPQDGFLRLHDIYNLELPADLVVISGCQTGLGKDIKGEGLVGLTRGFMHAGAARVVVSLWNVDDEATATLMRLFYTNVLKAGMPVAAALRSAQQAMADQTRWQSPYYWAAFVLQGEYR